MKFFMMAELVINTFLFQPLQIIYPIKSDSLLTSKLAAGLLTFNWFSWLKIGQSEEKTFYYKAVNNLNKMTNRKRVLA